MIGSRFAASTWTFLVLALSLGAGAPKEEQGRREARAMPPEIWARTNFSAPGAEHRLLEPLVGTFDAQVKWWMSPDSPAVESRATCEGQLVLGGRFLQETCAGRESGQAFQALGLTGYDNHKRRYMGVRADTMGTSLVPCEGAFDGEGKILTLTCEFVDPATGRKVTSRRVTRIDDAGARTEESYETEPDGIERKTMEIVYTRR